MRYAIGGHYIECSSTKAESIIISSMIEDKEQGTLLEVSEQHGGEWTYETTTSRTWGRRDIILETGQG